MKKYLIGCLSGLMIMLVLSCSEEKVESNCTSSSSITEKSSAEADNALLKQLLQEINDLANSKTCVDASKWKTTPLGNKACGGPSTYIAYSSEIDEDCFLKKVEHYTAQAKMFNTKYGIISDCMLIMEPKGVKCVNGKPELNY
jgi:hypothetical protein